MADNEVIDYSKQPCHSQACAIQNCLQKKSYDESKCSFYIDQLYACCFNFYKAQVPGSDDRLPENTSDLKRTVSCPFPELLKIKIDQRLKDSNVDAKLLDVMKDKRK